MPGRLLRSFQPGESTPDPTRVATPDSGSRGAILRKNRSLRHCEPGLNCERGSGRCHRRELRLETPCGAVSRTYHRYAKIATFTGSRGDSGGEERDVSEWSRRRSASFRLLLQAYLCKGFLHTDNSARGGTSHGEAEKAAKSATETGG
jgi:hypothetical protein